MELDTITLLLPAGLMAYDTRLLLVNFSSADTAPLVPVIKQYTMLISYTSG